MQGRFLNKNGTQTVDTGTTGVMDANNDRSVVDVSELTNVSCYINQLVDNGTVALLVEKTVDGVNWATLATKAATDLPVGANVALEITLSDANGMPTRAKQVRLTLSSYTGTGTYSFGAAGSLLPSMGG